VDVGFQGLIEVGVYKRWWNSTAIEEPVSTGGGEAGLAGTLPGAGFVDLPLCSGQLSANVGLLAP